uniref:EF-hand domain-containing protein n=1 Tax=Euplotes crassus TaxID=5936 RepID=A0A7S3KAG0_EUPCR|mmetsp:Transcript_17568/g.17300  ORF Transcript_17568/g.17300 Transcript_17568/m.17300 type:complete len:105 (+) Transcript_17568:156-470(+)
MLRSKTLSMKLTWTATALLILKSSPNLCVNKMADTDVDEELKNAFDLIDLNGNGRISAPELKRLFDSAGDKVTDEEVEEMIREADLDGDGLIDIDEFKRVTYCE